MIESGGKSDDADTQMLRSLTPPGLTTDNVALLALRPELTMPSTVIRSFKYDAAGRRLFIVFQTGRQYIYEDVPPEIYKALQCSPSKGEFFNANIRDSFSFVREPARR